VGATEQLEFRSYKNIEQLFEKIGYTRENWQKGVRKIPRIYLREFPERWKDQQSDTITVAVKKRKDSFSAFWGRWCCTVTS